MSDFADALRCAERARDLSRDLSKVRGPGDLAQIAAGLNVEIDCIIQRLSDGLDAIRTAAAGDRPGKERNDALPTSRDAARLVVRSGTQRADVLLALFRWGDLTDYEIQERLAMDQNSERPRRGELVDAQLVAPTVAPGGVAVTKQHKGRDWQVWRLTQLGVDAATRIAGLSGVTGAVTTQQSQSLF
jgi:hypothetical protein